MLCARSAFLLDTVAPKRTSSMLSTPKELPRGVSPKADLIASHVEKSPEAVLLYFKLISFTPPSLNWATSLISLVRATYFSSVSSPKYTSSVVASPKEAFPLFWYSVTPSEPNLSLVILSSGLFFTFSLNCSESGWILLKASNSSAVGVFNGSLSSTTGVLTGKNWVLKSSLLFE